METKAKLTRTQKDFVGHTTTYLIELGERYEASYKDYRVPREIRKRFADILDQLSALNGICFEKT